MDIRQVTSFENSGTDQMGQAYFACGKSVVLRRWEEGVCEFREVVRRPSDTVGYGAGCGLELGFDGQVVRLGAGDSCLVPEDASHRYRITEPIIAIEGTRPPVRVNERDYRET